MKSPNDESHFVPAPCQVACPIGTDAPSYIAAIWERDFDAAIEAITATNPFSAICGRVCDAPCEPACRRTDSDGPVAIRNLKRIVMEQLGDDFTLPTVEVSRDQSIAIIGAGPCGMTAAQDLAEAGFRVHIYEMTDRLGGMMVWGIPAFRLPPGTIDQDINRILGHCPGIEVHLNCGLGSGVTLDELREQHDAVLLTIGAWWGKPMGVPGDTLEGITDGVGFLRKVNDGERPEMTREVIVVGAGDVAMDACRVALRMPGCESVRVVYRRGPDEIPARKDELEGSIKEGVEIVYFTQPVSIERDGDELVLHSIRTEMGAPGGDGRRVPVPVEGSEHELRAGQIIAAVGQKTICDEMQELGQFERDRITTSFESMQTDVAGVFAAGDGAFGPSTIVNAMYHGHRAAYYLQAELEGRKNPPPYQTPYRTRAIPVAQDAEWELFSRQEQEFHGLGENPVEFPDIESVYDLETARKEAARCYRCDAETGTYDYSVVNREHIFEMARASASDTDKQVAMLSERLHGRPNPFPEGHGESLDDLCILPANLSRLVIDPYREACKTIAHISDDIALDTPLLITGFDNESDAVRIGIGEAIAGAGAAYIGARSPGDQHLAHWIQVVKNGDPIDDRAMGVVVRCDNGEAPIPGDHVGTRGLWTGRDSLIAALDTALAEELDLVVIDAARGNGAWPEADGHPELGVLRDAVRHLRAVGREGDIALFYFGGVRSGTDVAKVVALGSVGAVLGVSMALALGAQFRNGNDLALPVDLSREEAAGHAANLIRSATGEASMMARCAGKTRIDSLEPEDIQSISCVTAEAAGVPLAGT